MTHRSALTSASSGGVRQVWFRPAIGVDIGGTKVAAGLVDIDGRILRRADRVTPGPDHEPDVVEDAIAAVIEELREQRGPVAVGIGAAGLVDNDKGVVRFSPHLSWRQEPLREAIRKRTGLPVHIDNDANASLWAQVRFGSARGCTDVIAVNLGTGIGGAFFLAGQMYRGRYGGAGEFGHMRVVSERGRLCPCGSQGCWEQYASGTSLLRRVRQLHIEHPNSVSPLLAALKRHAHRVTGPMVTEAARAGDDIAIKAFAELGHWLGIGLADIAAAFDPELFVIGGGVSAAGEFVLGPARRVFEQHVVGGEFRPLPRIVRAEWGSDAGVIGAADLARDAARRFPRHQAIRGIRASRPRR
ncbi:MAG: ROK family glucokinase [Actinomycetota bacterium]